MVPDLKLHYFNSQQSSALKDYGVSVSSGEYVAVLEADCIPSSNWLRLLLAAVRTDDLAVSSGRTSYGFHSTYRRVMSLLDRSWDDLGDSGETNMISNNGAVYRRSILERFPYPDAVTPFLSAHERNKRIRRAGHRFYYERNAVMIHAIGGWSFVRDFHRNKGHQAMESCARKSFAAIPGLLVKRIRVALSNYRRLGAQYLSWYDWPFAVVMLFTSRIPELVGMIDALRNVDRIPGTAYR